MGLADDKKNIFTSIGSFSSLKEQVNLPDTTNIFTSVNNKKETIPFLIDSLKVTVGSDAIKRLTGELFTKLADTAEIEAKKTIANQLIQYNAGDALPSFLINTGVSVPIKDIDIFDKFKTLPNSLEGDLLYNNITENFDNKAFDAILNEGNEIELNGMLIKYDSISESFNYKPTSGSTSKKFGEWITDYIKNSEFFDKKTFLAAIMNIIYASVTKNQNKSKEKILEELKYDKLIQQLIDEDDSFEINQNDLNDLQQKANEIYDGILYYDLGCGLLTASYSITGMTNLISEISGSTNPFKISNLVENTIDESSLASEDTSTQNKETIKDKFFEKIINAIQLSLTKSVTTSPQVRTLLAVSSAIKTGGTVEIGNPLDDLKRNKIFLKCVINDMKKVLNEFIFNIATKEITQLIKPIIKNIIKEKLNQYKSIITSLVSSKIKIK